MNRAAWQEHARQRQTTEPQGPSPAPPRIYWGQHPGVGPGAEILGDLTGRTVIDLGCGPGHHAAYLLTLGAIVTGIDIADAQIERARNRYGHLAGITFTVADAIDFLGEVECDICYSVFGAVGLAPPERLLPAIAAALRPGGLLAFSVPHPGRWAHSNWLTLPFGDRVPIQRWKPSVSSWPKRLIPIEGVAAS
ncbi:class I SAM-dependent methyltransferase [Microtetraspora sp. NBRC 16547]|uniref:class I SAM-dependent methyltransferase n=1 Tax=Microtetraspora sp. NBRC 16547 TaxID=3030993 RepID=UPI0024A414A2|nr:class I SAM-dependent methyltransferase [Microtetraspora sp. NBRC 16547]GLW98908.1 hypothetical protein Misp02_29950 [Microtetraspora sp. NBRC 16547]